MKTVADIRGREGVPAARACAAAGVPYSTYKRWRARGATMTAWQRTELAEDLAFRAAALLAETGGDTPRQAWKAWRIVAEDWLLESGEVVEKTNNVLPHSFGRLGS